MTPAGWNIFQSDFNKPALLAVGLGGRQTKFLMLKNNQSKIRMNSLVNKFYVLNNKIELSDLDKSMNCYNYLKHLKTKKI